MKCRSCAIIPSFSAPPGISAARWFKPFPKRRNRRATSLGQSRRRRRRGRVRLRHHGRPASSPHSKAWTGCRAAKIRIIFLSVEDFPECRLRRLSPPSCPEWSSWIISMTGSTPGRESDPKMKACRILMRFWVSVPSNWRNGLLIPGPCRRSWLSTDFTVRMFGRVLFRSATTFRWIFWKASRQAVRFA